MKPEAQIIAIAKLRGWTQCEKYTPRRWMDDPAPEPFLRGIAPGGTVFRQLPDYLSNLAEMHEAENDLSLEQKDKFLRELQIVVAPQDKKGDRWFWLCVHATAAQRAKAFLHTLGKWREK